MLHTACPVLRRWWWWWWLLGGMWSPGPSPTNATEVQCDVIDSSALQVFFTRGFFLSFSFFHNSPLLFPTTQHLSSLGTCLTKSSEVQARLFLSLFYPVRSTTYMGLPALVDLRWFASALGVPLNPFLPPSFWHELTSLPACLDYSHTGKPLILIATLTSRGAALSAHQRTLPGLLLFLQIPKPCRPMSHAVSIPRRTSYSSLPRRLRISKFSSLSPFNIHNYPSSLLKFPPLSPMPPSPQPVSVQTELFSKKNFTLNT